MNDDLARKLWNARASGAKLSAATGQGLASEAEAYSIQAQVVETSELAVIGWKIGATNPALFPVLGVDKPFLGPLYQRYTYQAGESVKIAPGDALECELTIELSADLAPRAEPYSREEIGEAVASIMPSFEVVGSRFEGDFAGAGFKLIADGGANVATVLGAPFHDWAGLDVRDIGAALSINGSGSVDGSTANLMWDHLFDAVAWVIAQPALSTRGLLAGDVIMSGTCTGITPLKEHQRAEVSFAGVGAVSAEFSVS